MLNYCFPGKKGASAGIGVWWGDDHKMNTAEPASRPTNNCAEIEAAIKAIRLAKGSDVQKLKVFTDSQFLINCVTKWLPGWKKNGWKTKSNEDVKNKVELQVLDKLLDNKSSPGFKLKWQHVRGHQGIYGNEKADELARRGAEKYKP